jgi:two-component system sensor histidine kinase DegS
LRSREEFTQQLLKAEEQERRRLAAELHDGLGQNLSLVKNRCHQATIQSGLSDAVKSHLRAISESTLTAIDEVRSLVRNLRPIQLEQRGLTDSINELIEQVEQSTKIRLKSRVENVDDAFTGGSAMQLYRIVQEALNNLMKHSGADQASLKLERDINCVRLQVTDNGTGFDPDKVMPRGGFGLKNIYERARMLGGWSRIQNIPGSGARLTVEVPLHEESRDET